jgi:hypothetical protein
LCLSPLYVFLKLPNFHVCQLVHILLHLSTLFACLTLCLSLSIAL